MHSVDGSHHSQLVLGALLTWSSHRKNRSACSTGSTPSSFMLKNFPIIREGEGEGAIRHKGVIIGLVAGRLYITPLRTGSSLVDAATHLAIDMLWWCLLLSELSQSQGRYQEPGRMINDLGWERNVILKESILWDISAIMNRSLLREYYSTRSMQRQQTGTPKPIKPPTNRP